MDREVAGSDQSFYKLASCKWEALYQKMSLLTLWGQKKYKKEESQGNFSAQTITEKPITWIHSLHQLGVLLVSTRQARWTRLSLTLLCIS